MREKKAVVFVRRNGIIDMMNDDEMVGCCVRLSMQFFLNWGMVQVAVRISCSRCEVKSRGKSRKPVGSSDESPIIQPTLPL